MPLYAAWLKEHASALIELLRVRHATTLAHLEGACGVTRTYFSKLLGGNKTTSLTLVRLLEDFVADPSELQRHLEGRAWTPTFVAGVRVAASGEAGRGIVMQRGEARGRIGSGFPCNLAEDG